MAETKQPEVWLRGPIVGIAPLLQPVAHSLLQCREEVQSAMIGLTSEQIWSRPGGAAPIDYHIRHALGSLDRLFTEREVRPGARILFTAAGAGTAYGAALYKVAS